MMHPCKFLCLSLAFTFILIPLVSARHCYYCDMTDANNCMEKPVCCGERENCFVARGLALGLPHVISKGCVQAIFCGRDQPIIYLGVTYNLTTYCCQGEFCNAGYPRHVQTPPDATTVAVFLAGLLLLLLMCWLL
ncbi:sperm acrosome membrane-associated protein 4-like [Antechinus flavipes]|uniref:sperm acrosome membrane-associated protein 4-like n=1 Tax=Antechinus flavipes TaxID=38775 RepID=UPI002236515A|nr:sperm acrosome membrane-associated protein 4-like [Antechinus flavipes]